MKDFAVDMVEQINAWYFSVDCSGRKEYLYKQRTGLLQRQFNENRVSKSVELNSLADARPLVSGKISTASLKTRDIDIHFNPGKILRDNETVLETLRQLQLNQWKMIVRANQTHRLIIKKGSKNRKTAFTYFSLLIKLRLEDRQEVIEVGEGSVQTLKFNQDGLSSRIKRIVDNHRDRKPRQFSGKEKVPVILNSGDGAILFHEILGHSLEADYIYRKQSPICLEDIGKPVVSKNVTLVTAYNNDTFFNGIPCDDEGETAQSSVLVERGVLKNLISDSFYKERLGLKNCGFSRLEDFTRNPLPRMYALYLKPGNYHPEELIASTKYGIYAGEFGEGKVFFDQNFFRFNIREARLIKNGKLSLPLGSIVVQGDILEVLNSVDMVANDFRFDKGISYCFKDGQTINVRVGQPTVKINNLYV